MPGIMSNSKLIWTFVSASLWTMAFIFAIAAIALTEPPALATPHHAEPAGLCTVALTVEDWAGAESSQAGSTRCSTP